MSDTETPRDKQGNPKAKINSYIEETIPTAKYANVKISHSVTRWVDDENLVEQLEENIGIVEQAIKIDHERILKELEEGN